MGARNKDHEGATFALLYCCNQPAGVGRVRAGGEAGGGPESSDWMKVAENRALEDENTS